VKKLRSFVTLFGDSLGARDLHALVAKDFLHAPLEIRNLDRSRWVGWQKTGYDDIASGNEDFFASAQTLFNSGEVITQVVNGCGLH